jgi:hypothetical protein
MLSAQGRAADGDAGRQVNSFARTGVSEMPVTACGPAMTRSRRCGRSVNP